MTEDLTDEERAFRALLANPKAFRVWAERVRREWMKRRVRSAANGS